MIRTASVAAIFASVALGAAPAPIGIFDGQEDVGAPAIAGSASYDEAAKTYTVTAGGTNMWGARDEFHFVWKRMKGDFTLAAEGAFPREGVDPHRKLGLIVRTSLDPASAYVDAAVHGNGLTALQYRRAAGAETQEVRSTVMATKHIELTRHGHTYTMSVGGRDAPTPTVLEDVDLGDEVYAGIFVCSHNPKVSETAVFRNVKIF